MEIYNFWDVHWVDLIGRSRIQWFLSQNHRKFIQQSTQISENTIFKDLRGFWGLGWSFLPSKPIPWDRFHLEVSVGGPNSSQSSTKYRNVSKMTCGPRLCPYTIHRLETSCDVTMIVCLMSVAGCISENTFSNGPSNVSAWFLETGDLKNRLTNHKTTTKLNTFQDVWSYFAID